MARTDNLKNYLEDVATAIKNKKKNNAPIKASEFDTEIENLPSGSGDVGEYFSSEITSGNSTRSGWVQTVKKLPKYVFNGTSLTYSFTNFTGEQLDLSYMNIENVDNISYAFRLCINLTNLNINGWDASKINNINNTFASCSVLTNLLFMNNLGKGYLTTQSENYSAYKVGLSDCIKLTHESALDVINKVYNIANIGVQPQQIQFNSNVLSQLSEEEIAIATEKGWNVTA